MHGLFHDKHVNFRLGLYDETVHKCKLFLHDLHHFLRFFSKKRPTHNRERAFFQNQKYADYMYKKMVVSIIIFVRLSDVLAVSVSNPKNIIFKKRHKLDVNILQLVCRHVRI